MLFAPERHIKRIGAEPKAMPVMDAGVMSAAERDQPMLGSMVHDDVDSGAENARAAIARYRRVPTAAKSLAT